MSLSVSKPLQGKRIVVTRAQQQADTFLAKLTALGAEAIEFPVIKIVPPLDFEFLDQAIANLATYDWLIFTSQNTVDYFWQRLPNAKALAGVKVCAVGSATSAALSKLGITPNLVPKRHVAEGILAELGMIRGLKILLPQGDLARDALQLGLEEAGASVNAVVAYRTVMVDDDNEGTLEFVRQLENNQIDLITFTSSSTVHNFKARLATVSPKELKDLLAYPIIACIGPVTSATVREYDLAVGIEAIQFTTDGLLEAIINYYELC